MTRASLQAEIDHSTACLHAVFDQYAGAMPADHAYWRNEALFWAGNRARARRMMQSA